MTILVCEDNPITLKTIAFTLIKCGYQVLQAEDGDQGIEILQNDKVDVVITDINMPNMDGLELIKKVREEGKHRFTPIVMLTTESSEEKKKAGLEAGASGWIVKPFKPEQLLKVVKMVLGE